MVGNVDTKLDGRGLAGTQGAVGPITSFRKTNISLPQAPSAREREFDLLSELYMQEVWEAADEAPEKSEEENRSNRVMSRDEIREELVGGAEVSEQELRELHASAGLRNQALGSRVRQRSKSW